MNKKNLYQLEWELYNPNFEFIKEFPAKSSPWFGHIFFAYDLVANTKPKLIVELGTYKGNSLFSFAQSIKDNNLNTTLHAVDTWEGDEHSGFYGKDLFTNFIKLQKKYYRKLDIQIHKTLFDNAVTEFKDNSINLLHIDGLHTYEAVKHDFETWLPKVNKNNGVIMLHDVCEIRDDFGVYKLWEELQRKYKTVTFPHSHGLGVIFLNENPFCTSLNLINILVKYYENLASQQLLQDKYEILMEVNNKKDKQIKLLTEENNSRIISIGLLNKELENISAEANQFRNFKKTKVWNWLTKWQNFKRKIHSIIK